MKSRITELSCKEVINVCNGTRYGFVNDVEVDCVSGKIVSLIVHCSGKIAALFSKSYDVTIPWEAIRKIGEDIILVDYVIEPECESKTGFFIK